MIPGQSFEPPAAVIRLAATERLGHGEPVWVNELGGVTFQFPAVGQFVKWAPWHPELNLAGEAARLRWAHGYVTVPFVIGTGADAHGQWLRMLALPGRSAVDPRWLADARTAARVIGSGLRLLHDRLPVADCPFSWSLEDRSLRIKKPQDRRLIEQAPPIDRLVVCHGDACAPNTLITSEGTLAGHVDFGQLGVADRWADLAVATYSLGWNFRGHWEGELLQAYGVEPDDERIAYYRRLWDAT